MFSTSVCETVSGKFISTLDCKINSWARELNGTDTATIQLSPGALTTANRDHLRNITTAWRMSLLIAWEGIPVFYGPIITRQWDGTALKINAGGIRLLLARRKAHNWAMPYATQLLAYTNMSLGSIGVALVRDVAENGSKPGSRLPIVCPANVVDSDPTHQRTYNGFENKDVDTLLHDLTGVQNGPDFDFLPGWTDASQTAMQYTMRVGTPTAPALIQPNQIVFDATQPLSAVRKVTYTEDASQLVTTEWASGAGTDTGILMSKTTSAVLTSAGWPLLEGERDYKTVSNQSILDTHTAGDLATNQVATVQWGLHIDATLPPAFGSYLLGDIARVRIANHLWIPDNDNYLMRIIGMSGDSTKSVKLLVQGV